LVSHVERGTFAEGVSELGAEGDIWVQEGGNDRRLEKIA